jgi:hypothetical protein
MAEWIFLKHPNGGFLYFKKSDSIHTCHYSTPMRYRIVSWILWLSLLTFATCDSGADFVPVETDESLRAVGLRISGKYNMQQLTRLGRTSQYPQNAVSAVLNVSYQANSNKVGVLLNVTNFNIGQIDVYNLGTLDLRESINDQVLLYQKGTEVGRIERFQKLSIQGASDQFGEVLSVVAQKQ